jgi:EAL domain-containing protein (putative c-di-GMP-specific phosphodiesterase class I)
MHTRAVSRLAIESDLRRAIETRLLELARVDPSSLILELTESVMAENRVAATETQQALRWMSVPIAMDDFGTGYSSLSSLSQFPLDILKIDRSFVERLDRDPEGRAIVYAIMSLANTLGMRVTGEGIETAEQLAALIEVGCQYGQGHFLGEASPRRRAGGHAVGNEPRPRLDLVEPPPPRLTHPPAAASPMDPRRFHV